MKTYSQPGDVLSLTAPSGGVVSGTAYLIGALVVVALVTAAQGESFSAMLTGTAELAKATSQSWTEGAALYWDNSAKKFTTTSGGNTLCGAAAAAAGSADTTGLVRLDGVVR